VGERYEKLIQLRIDRIMSIVPLIIIAALGLMVLLIAWSMLLAIFVAMHGLQGQGHH
jgi:type II secretory pathway component PulF